MKIAGNLLKILNTVHLLSMLMSGLFLIGGSSNLFLMLEGKQADEEVFTANRSCVECLADYRTCAADYQTKKSRTVKQS